MGEYGSYLERLDSTVGKFNDLVRDMFAKDIGNAEVKTSLIPHVESLRLKPRVEFPRLNHLLAPGHSIIIERPLEGREMQALVRSWFDGGIIHINNPRAASEEESLITYHVRNGRLMKHFLGESVVDPFGDFNAGFGPIADDVVEDMSLHPTGSPFVKHEELCQLLLWVTYADITSYSAFAPLEDNR